MSDTYVSPIAFAAGGTTAGVPLVPSAKKAVTVIVLGTSLIVSSTSALAAVPDDIVRRFANARTNSGTVLDRASSQRSLADAIGELRRRSGLTWEQLAGLFDVDRRSVHLWASGRPLNAANAERLNRILGLIRRVDQGSPSATRAWLLTPMAHGELPLDMLREGRFDDISTPAIVPPPHRGPGPLSESAKRNRAPLAPAVLVAARSDRVHIEKGRLIKATRLKFQKPK